jgi:hypothetical protein
MGKEPLREVFDVLRHGRTAGSLQPVELDPPELIRRADGAKSSGKSAVRPVRGVLSTHDHDVTLGDGEVVLEDTPVASCGGKTEELCVNLPCVAEDAARLDGGQDGYAWGSQSEPFHRRGGGAVLRAPFIGQMDRGLESEAFRLHQGSELSYTVAGQGARAEGHAVAGLERLPDLDEGEQGVAPDVLGAVAR